MPCSRRVRHAGPTWHLQRTFLKRAFAEAVLVRSARSSGNCCPPRNNLIIATMKTSAADLVAQCVIEQKPVSEVDWKRNLATQLPKYCMLDSGQRSPDNIGNQGSTHRAQSCTLLQLQTCNARCSACLEPCIWALSSCWAASSRQASKGSACLF